MVDVQGKVSFISRMKEAIVGKLEVRWSIRNESSFNTAPNPTTSLPATKKL